MSDETSDPSKLHLPTVNQPMVAEVSLYHYLFFIFVLCSQLAWGLAAPTVPPRDFGQIRNNVRPCRLVKN
jgi:hypothetical protein